MYTRKVRDLEAKLKVGGALMGQVVACVEQALLASGAAQARMPCQEVCLQPSQRRAGELRLEAEAARLQGKELAGLRPEAEVTSLHG